MSNQRVWRKSSYSGANTNCVEISLSAWHTSTYSGQYNTCVEVAALPSTAAVRDSKYPEAATLTFPNTEWRAFVTEATRGEL